jgi:surface protein
MLLRYDCSQFYDCSRFESNLTSWDVSSVTTMERMFYGATSFRSDLSTWNVENVRNLESMFQRASSFTSNLYRWGDLLYPADEVNVEDMFVDSGCPVTASPVDFGLGPWCFQVDSALPEVYQ